MGLSDEERRSGMYFAIRELSRLTHEWEGISDHYEREQYAVVRNLASKLWHAFLGKQSNGLHWFMGSSSSNAITHDPVTPWETAVVHHLEKVVRDKNPPWEDEEEKPFNALEHLGIAGLLSHSRWAGQAASHVFKIYQWTEQLIYYLRRYDDDFRHNFEEVSRICSEIFGECFSIFSQNEAFAKAYVIHQIMEIMYGCGYPYNNDVVADILSSNNLHHDYANLMDWSTEDLADYHIELVQVKTEAEKKASDAGAPHLWWQNRKLMRLRLITALTLATKLGEYTHMRKDILVKLRGSELEDAIPEVNQVFGQVEERFQEEKKDKDNRYEKDRVNQALDAYGHRGYDLMRDYFEERPDGDPQKTFDFMDEE